MRILALDPGNEQSAALVYDLDTQTPTWWTKAPNDEILHVIDDQVVDVMAIEMVASYGMAVGATVFETCVWAGRFIERWTAGEAYRGRQDEPERVFRREVKAHLCGNQRARDTNIRQAIIDRYGPGRERAVGLKASPGPLYGLKADCWSALAVALTAAETRLTRQEAAA